MIPQGSVINNAINEEVQQPSRTYRLDLDKKRVVGMIDELGAVKQAVYKILLTIRFEHLIYSSNYGFDGGSVGSQRNYFESETKRKVREALTQDDRITDVVDFKFSYDGDSATVRFTVISEYGQFAFAQEVS